MLPTALHPTLTTIRRTTTSRSPTRSTPTSSLMRRRTTRSFRLREAPLAREVTRTTLTITSLPPRRRLRPRTRPFLTRRHTTTLSFEGLPPTERTPRVWPRRRQLTRRSPRPRRPLQRLRLSAGPALVRPDRAPEDQPRHPPLGRGPASASASALRAHHRARRVPC